jgi:hypothetical protein
MSNVLKDTMITDSDKNTICQVYWTLTGSLVTSIQFTQWDYQN